MKILTVDTNQIEDAYTFHRYFKELMGFPDFYGGNMDAWIDCMTYVDEPESGMTQVTVAPGELLILHLKNVVAFKNRCREVYDNLMECTAFVNYRRIFHDSGEGSPVLVISFFD